MGPGRALSGLSSMNTATRKLKVVHIIPTLALGGAERILTELVRYGNRDAFDFAVITIVDGGPLEADIRELGVPYYPLKKTSELGLVMLVELIALLNRLEPDIVHTHLFGGHLWGEIASKLNRVPHLVFSEQNTDVDIGELKHRIKQVLSYGSSAVVAASDGIKKFLVEEENFPTDKITVIRNAVETGRFAQIPPAPFGEVMQLLAIGRLEPQKGHDILLNALSTLRDVPWELTLVGEGSAKDSLVDLAIINHMHDRVHFVGTHMDVAPYLAASDVVVMSSRWEGIGLVIMEAMAAGRTVIASNVGGIPELIDDGVTGMLVPVEDVDALQVAIRRVWQNQAAARELGAAARVKAQKDFDIRAMVADYERVYAHLAHQ